ncbi:MAG TPA: ABC transporter permease [Candidatus Angelobacter sp.]|nr:ABC transporter permease [Candidatus Angelobacter sp.]
MGEFFRRVYYLLNRSKLERELQSEIDFHREMLSAESRTDFGNPTLMRERSREAWGWGWLDRLAQDLRFGFRLLKKSPGVTFTAIMVLALGIGVNVTAFNLVDVIFFKPLHVRDPHSLVRFSGKSPTSNSNVISYPATVFYQQSAALSAVMAQTSTRVTFTEETNQEIRAGVVTANYFRELGGSAAYGRLFDPATDDTPDAPPVVVLGYNFWQRQFGGDPSVVGRTIRLNQHPATIIGVIPFNFIGLDPEHGETDEVWLIISRLGYFVPDTRILTDLDDGESGVHMSARLKPGVTRQAAAAALEPLSRELVRQHPDKLPKGYNLALFPGGYVEAFDPADLSFLPMFGLFATLVLLILVATCSNLGNLFLGQAVTREREISIRMALGATRRRIIRQLMTESVLLALLGAATGLFLSWAISRPMVAWLGGPGRLDLAPDWRTILFAFVIGGLASVLFGLSPARQATRPAHKASRARTIFMAAQIAASCVLLVVSGLLVRGLQRAYRYDPGFDYTHVITVDPQLYAHGYEPAKATQFMDELQSRLRQLPGVEAASLVRNPPLGNRVTMQRAHDDIKVNIHQNEISPHYFQTMSIPLLRGRDFMANDQDVIIVSESCARALWPGKDPLQQTWKLGEKKYSVIGLAGNARTTALRNGDDAQIYMPVTSANVNASILLVKASRPPENLVANLGAMARAIDPVLSPNVQPLKAMLAERLSDSKKMTGVVGGMGMLALVLAVLGLYGVVAYNVSQKRREIGIRIALGANSSQVVQNMVANFFLPLSIAMAVGLVLAALLSGILRQFLYGLSNFDPLSYLGAVLLLAIVGGVASLLPARRALKVNPMEALRCE